MFPTFLLDAYHQQPRRRGMTLVDLSVAVLILSIVSAITAPRMVEMLERHKIEAAAQLLVENLNHLRSRAITEGRSLTVDITDQPLGIRCDQIEMPNQPGQTYFFDLSAEASITEANWEGISDSALVIDRFGDFYDRGIQVKTCALIIGNRTALATVTIGQGNIYAETSRR